jgi:hypothetical protein
LGVRASDDRGVEHRGVSHEFTFDLCRRHLIRVDFDDVLDAVDEYHVPVDVDVAEITGAEPAVGSDHHVGVGGSVEVALHYLWSPRLELTVESRAEGRAALWVDDPNLCVGQRLPHGPRGGTGASVGNREGATCLCESPALPDRASG